MTPSLNKCPRCGTLRPSGEVAHTCVVVAPDHEAAVSWAKKIPKQATVSMDDENLSRAYLDLVAREQRAVELLREVCVQYECTDFNVTSDLYEMARAFLAERREV